MNSNSTTIPSWFLHFATFIMVTLIPWAAWVTVQNIEMGVKQGYILERIQKIEKAQDRPGG